MIKKEHYFKTLIIKNKLPVFMICLTIPLLILISHIPIFCAPNAIHDDALMTNLATDLLKFNWLGAYNSNTFVKGIGFPVFLAITNFLGIDYFSASIILYSLSCAIFIFAIKPLFKEKYPLYIIYTLLLLSPTLYASQTLQKVYRNGITQAQVLLIIGCIMAIYIRRKVNVKSLLPWAIVGGISLAWLYNTREDGFWILPFIIVAAMVTIMAIISNKCFTEKKELIKKILVSVLPTIILIFSILLISTINYFYYGEFLTTELSKSNFPETMKNIYSVQPSEADSQLNDRISISTNTIQKIYTVSPTLNSISKELNHNIAAWDNNDSHPGDGQVENGWFFWCLREAVSDAGYYDTPQHANDFYYDVNIEMESAFENGSLEKRATMPSALMGPWREGYGKKIIYNMGKCISYTSGFDGVSTVNPEISDGFQEEARNIEVITNKFSTSPELGTESGYFTNISIYILNSIGNVYKMFGHVVTILAAICYILITVLLIKKKKNNDTNTWNVWLLLTAILGCFLVLIAGVSYNEVASCPSINYMYLSGTYPMLLAFSSISILYIIESFKNLKKGHIKHIE